MLDEGFKPAIHSRICSVHFEDDCNRNVCLRASAVSTKFDFPAHLQKTQSLSEIFPFGEQLLSVHHLVVRLSASDCGQRSTDRTIVHINARPSLWYLDDPLNVDGGRAGFCFGCKSFYQSDISVIK